MKKVHTPPLTSDTDLGCIVQLSEYMHLKHTYLHALKRCANERHSKTNPTCFTGTKSCKKWIMEWLSRGENRDFKITLVYPAKAKAGAETTLMPAPSCQFAA